ncbi:hypothetical protein [Mariniluteicoccus flavus]
MTFDDLPENWADRPVWDSNLADVVDMFLSIKDRLRNSVCLLLCDDDGHLQVPCILNDVPFHDPRERPELPEDFVHHLRDFTPRILVAFGHRRPGVTLDDLRWRAGLADQFARAGIPVIGFFTGDLQGVHPIPDAAAFVA